MLKKPDPLPIMCIPEYCKCMKKLTFPIQMLYSEMTKMVEIFFSIFKKNFSLSDDKLRPDHGKNNFFQIGPRVQKL